MPPQRVRGGWRGSVVADRGRVGLAQTASLARVVAERAPVDARRLRLVRCKIARLLLGDLVDLVVRCVRHMGYIIAQTSDAAPDGLVQRPREFGQAVPRASEPEVTISLDARKLAEPPRLACSPAETTTMQQNVRSDRLLRTPSPRLDVERQRPHGSQPDHQEAARNSAGRCVASRIRSGIVGAGDAP